MTCKKCGASIPGGAPGTMVRCEYCGHTEHIPAPVPPKPGVAIDPQLVTRQVSASVRRAILLGVVGMLVMIGAGVFVCVGVATQTSKKSKHAREVERQMDDQMDRAQKQIDKARKRISKALDRAGMPHPGPRGKQWKLAEVNKAPKDRWFDVDQTGITGTLEQFDAIANYAWVHKLARAWSADAKLVRLGIDRVRHDGVAPNVGPSGKGDIDYRFYSPSRYAAAEKLAEVSEQKVYDGFRVWIHEGKIQAMIGEGDPEARKYAAPPMDCSYAQIIASAKPIKKAPYYDMRLRYWKHHRRWEWYVSVAHSLRTRSRLRRRRGHTRSSTRVSATACKRK